MGRMGLSLASGVMSVAGITRTVLVVGAPTAGTSSENRDICFYMGRG